MDHPKAKSLISRFLELFFTQLYHKLAWSYDLVAAAVSLGRWNEWIRTVYLVIPQGRILELGFGPGHLQFDFLSAGRDIIGIDESPQMCRIARKRLIKSHLSPTLARADAQSLPFQPHHFNSVVATFPSPYIFQKTTLSEIRRVLHPAGNLIILLAAQPSGKRIADKIINLLFKITGEAPPSAVSLQRLEQRLNEAGFDAHHHYLTYKSDRLLLFTAIPQETTSHPTLDLTV